MWETQPVCAQMPGAGGAGGQALPWGCRCHRASTDSFQAKGKHLNWLTFELPGTLFTLAARVAVLQILNTVLTVIWGLLKSPPPACGLAWAQAGLSCPFCQSPVEYLLQALSQGGLIPSLQKAFCILCWGDTLGLSLLTHSPARSSPNLILCVRV